MANRLAPTITIKVAAASSVNSQSILGAIALSPLSRSLLGSIFNAKCSYRSTPAIHLGRCPEFSSSTFLYHWQQPTSLPDPPHEFVQPRHTSHTHPAGQ